MKKRARTGAVPASLAIVALAAAGPEPAAQDVRTNPRFYPVGGPLQRVVYDLGTHEVTRLASPPQGNGNADREEIRSSRVVANCFMNTNTMGYFTTGTTDTEWRDWAAKSTGKTGIVRQFYFGYISTANDPSSGAHGPAIEVAFYTGETGFCRKGGVEIPKSRFCFSGLPGFHTSLPTWIGLGFAVTAFVPKGRPFCVPDGKIGWSYGFKGAEDATGGSKSGPVMTSFVTANTCAADAYDLYNARPSTDGTCVGTFDFGGCEPLPQPPSPVGIPCASFFIGLGEDDGSDLASATFHDPQDCNAATFATDSGPVIGEPWQSTVSPVNHAICVLRVTSGACGAGFKPGNLNGTALYAVAPVATQQTSAGCGPGSHAWSLPVQKSFNLVGQSYCGQSIGVDTGPVTIFAENAENLVVGTTQ